MAAFGLDERTVAHWLVSAGQHCQRVHEHLVEQGQVDGVDGLEAVEVDGEVTDLQVVDAECVGSDGGHAGCTAFLRAAGLLRPSHPAAFGSRDVSPAGISRMTTMNRAPWK